MDTKFWLVWNPNGYSPRHRHATETLARNEAERLARINPGAEFVVLEAKCVAQKVDVLIRDLKTGGPVPHLVDTFGDDPDDGFGN